MRSRKAIIAAFSICALGLSFTACSNPDSAGGSTPSSNKPFEILAVMPMTGPLASSAQLKVNGLQAGAKSVNATGGIGGRHVTVKVLDDKADATQAVTLLQAEINSSTPPDFVWAGSTSTEALAMVPLLTNAQIVSASTASDLMLNDPTKYPYHFGAIAANDQNYPDLIKEAQAEGAKSIGFITGNDALGTDNVAVMKKAAAAANMPLTAQTFDAKSTDLVGPLDALKATKPDLLVMSSFGAGAGYLLDARQKLGWNVPTIGDLGTTASNPAKLVEAGALVGVKLQALSVAVTANKDKWLPAEAPAVKLIQAEGTVPGLTQQALSTFDLPQLLAAAASQSGGTSASQLKSAMESLKSPNPVPWTMYGSYGYSSTNHFPVLEPNSLVYMSAVPIVDGFF